MIDSVVRYLEGRRYAKDAKELQLFFYRRGPDAGKPLEQRATDDFKESLTAVNDAAVDGQLVENRRRLGVGRSKIRLKMPDELAGNPKYIPEDVFVLSAYIVDKRLQEPAEADWTHEKDYLIQLTSALYAGCVNGIVQGNRIEAIDQLHDFSPVRMAYHYIEGVMDYVMGRDDLKIMDKREFFNETVRIFYTGDKAPTESRKRMSRLFQNNNYLDLSYIIRKGRDLTDAERSKIGNLYIKQLKSSPKDEDRMIHFWSTLATSPNGLVEDSVRKLEETMFKLDIRRGPASGERNRRTATVIYNLTNPFILDQIGAGADADQGRTSVIPYLEMRNVI